MPERVQENVLGGGPPLWGTKVFPISDEGAIETEFSGTLHLLHCDVNSICRKARDVAKLAIFLKASIEKGATDLKGGKRRPRVPLSEGTAIKVSSTLLVTANHIFEGYNDEQHCIFVNFNSQPVIPDEQPMKKGGWIQVERIGREKNGSECATCSLDQDYIFLKPVGCGREEAIHTHSNLLPPLTNISNTVLVGFLCSSNSQEDYFDTLAGSGITEDECRQFTSQTNIRRMNRKLIFGGSMVGSSTCNHIINHNCISGCGVSGGLFLIVDNNSSVPRFCAMHLCRNMVLQGMCLKSSYFLA